jgi:putative hydrolase of the HAD superfamily
MLDHVIGSRAARWPLERMPAVDRALLRLGAYELAFEPALPIAVALNEAVELATSYSTDGSGGFVNGVLGAVARDVRDDGPWAALPWPEVLVVDVDGVVRHWAPTAVADAEAALGLDAGELAAVALAPERVLRANTGELTDAAWRDEVAAEVAARHGSDAALVAELWGALAWSIDDEVISVLRAVRAAGHRVAAFSNATDRLEADLDEAGVTDAFDMIVSSWRLGLVKPEAAAFRACLRSLAVPADRCLFVDDRPANVAGAIAAGMPAVRHRDAARLAATAHRCHLLDP